MTLTKDIQIPPLGKNTRDIERESHARPPIASGHGRSFSLGGRSFSPWQAVSCETSQYPAISL
nr:MAG TPA: hypothetical protein [Caudoviricetes sp.]